MFVHALQPDGIPSLVRDTAQYVHARACVCVCVCVCACACVRVCLIFAVVWVLGCMGMLVEVGI